MIHKKSNKSSRLSAIRPRVPHAVKKRLSRRKTSQNPLEVLSDLPRITNETVAEHREEVLSSARKYIYPLQHSRHLIIKISASLFVAAIIAFFVYCGLALYKFQSTTSFLYEVTRVIPFPVAKAGPNFVAYENYLFELRHLTHYYSTQQNENLTDESGKRQLAALKKDSLQKVIDDAYVKQIAEQNNISVSDREVDDQIALVKSQNRLGTSDQMLSDVLRQFWDWSISDFKRELKSQLLEQKVASELDVATQARARNALAQLQQTGNFEAVVAASSDDVSTKDKGGAYGFAISKTNRDVPPQVVDALFKLSPGQTSGIVNTGYTLEIVKNIKMEGDKVQAAHISFNLQNLSSRLDAIKAEKKQRKFISL